MPEISSNRPRNILYIFTDDQSFRSVSCYPGAHPWVNTPNQCDRTAWGVEVCKAVGSPRAKLLYDIYHMQIMEGDLIRTIQDNIEYIGHFHTAGNPGRRDLDEDQEIYYPPVMRAIADTGYQGFVGHEFRPKGDVIATLEATYAVCDV